jgi:4-hydroxybenzoate polyprenyltransferase
MIKFSHSIFALPFALLALVLATGAWPSPWVLFWVMVAMVAARSAAMGMNRIADRAYDAENPRTVRRELVTGVLSVRFAGLFTVGCIALFLLAAWQLNWTAFVLAPLVLVVLLGYSFLKRFTSLAHFGVGLALGLSPLGAWVAGTGGVDGDLRIPLVLGGGVLTWVAGFDVIYACQDTDVDRHLGLHSLPAKFGTRTALRIAAGLHVICVLCFAAIAPLADLGGLYVAAVAAVAALLVVEHRMVSPTDLTRVNVAFFTVNGFVSLLLGTAGIVDALL